MELLKSKAEEPKVIDEHKDIVVQEIVSATDHHEILSVSEDSSELKDIKDEILNSIYKPDELKDFKKEKNVPERAQDDNASLRDSILEMN